MVNRVIAWVFRKKLNVTVFGDSHARVFNYINYNGLMPKVKFNVISVGGATALGMKNPRSKTNALSFFRDKLREDEISRSSAIIIMLGEVDCGFVIWYRAKKYGDDIFKQVDDSLNGYFSFVNELREAGFKKIILISPVTPTIMDNSVGDVANERKEIDVSILERTKLTIQYSNKLSEFCKLNNIFYLDLLPNLIDTQTGIVETKFLNKNVTNHHLDKVEFSRLLVSRLKLDLLS